MLNENTVVTYDDLIKHALNVLKTSCVNLDSLNPNLPTTFKNGQVINRISKTYSETKMSAIGFRTVAKSAHTSIVKEQLN